VALADDLKARYPTEMTIVLQHEFWGLEVGEEGFGVTLSFNNVSQRIEIPFSAITVFADPSVEFGLQFNLTQRGDVESEEPEATEEAGEATTPSAAEGDAAETPDEKAKDSDGAEVVTLDQFRKKS
jgi:hypothetical protein